MTTAPIPRSITLSPSFFLTVFSDDFLFGNSPSGILRKRAFSTAEKNLAMQIHEARTYYPAVMDQCMRLCDQLNGLYFWQSNSEGPFVFASKILYLLRHTGKDAKWFIQQVKNARELQSQPAADLPKKRRATVIVNTPEGILLTLDHKNQWLLPGGTVERDELPLAAAIRELNEETALEARSIEFLFEHESQHYLHHVFVVHRYSGTAWAHSDAQALEYIAIQAGRTPQFPERLTRSNQEILNRYLAQAQA